MTADTEPANRHVLNEDNWKNKDKVPFTFCFHFFSRAKSKNQHRAAMGYPENITIFGPRSREDNQKVGKNPIRKQEKRTFTIAVLT